MCNLGQHGRDEYVTGMSSDECPVTRRKHGNSEELRLEVNDELLTAVRACNGTAKAGGARPPIAELSFVSL